MTKKQAEKLFSETIEYRQKIDGKIAHCTMLKYSELIGENPNHCFLSYNEDYLAIKDKLKLCKDSDGEYLCLEE